MSSFDPNSPPSLTSESIARLGRLVRKEVLEILRDRRTIVTLVAMPLLLYPLLTIAFKQFFLAGRVDPDKGREYFLGFVSDQEGAAFFRYVDYARKSLEAQRLRAKASQKKNDNSSKSVKQKVNGSKADALPDIPLLKRDKREESGAATLKGIVDSDLEKLVRDQKVDVGIRLRNFDELKEPGRDIRYDFDVLYLRGSPGAAGAMAYLQKLTSSLNELQLNMLYDQRQKRPTGMPVVVMNLERKPLKGGEEAGMISLAALVPLILILMTITGAVYPAIDLTAGERERGTLEILVAAPVPRLGLLFAKYVSVLTVAILTALVNLTTMTITLKLSGLGQMLLGEGGFTPLLILQVFGLLLLFASFFSAVLLSLTSFARSFKEAQAYLIPLMLFSMAPGIMGMIPGLELGGVLTVAPLINIVLLARDLFDGNTDPTQTMLVVVSTLLYAAVAISVAAKVFGAENVLYNEQATWSDLFRRPERAQPAASISNALICLACMVPVLFVVQSLLALIGPLPTVVSISLLPLITVLLYVVLPLLGSWMGRVQATTGWGLRRPALLALPAALILGLTLWPADLQLLLLLHPEEPAWRPMVESLLQAWREFPITQAVAMGIVGLAEEAFFRGYLFAALDRSMKPYLTVLLTTLLFGLMHGLLGGIGVDQIVPATVLGLVLGLVRWRTGSVIPGMMLHAVHNGILPLTHQWTTDWQDQVPLNWLALSAGGIVVGGLLIALSRPRKGELVR